MFARVLNRVHFRTKYRMAYYNAFDEYHVKNNLSAMENLFAKYINERLDIYLSVLL